MSAEQVATIANTAAFRPAEVSLNVASFRDEFTQDRLSGDHLLALNGRLAPTLAGAGTTPVFVFEDTETTVGGADDRQRAEAFFAGPLSAFVDQLDALAEFYAQSGGDLRRALAAAHEAAEHAASDQAARISLSHARFGIAQWH